jgi:NADPH:quinone reductase-like Zn-dependent oxidoreductase
MRRVVIRKPGGTRALLIEDAPEPTPSGDEVCVEVRAIGVNFADLVVRMGLYGSAKKYAGPVVVPGFEVSGTVRSVGERVTSFRPGDEVIGVTRFGGYATAICIPEPQIKALPRGLGFSAGATFPVVFLTAWYALVELSRLRPGYVVLVHSAAGGVGGALVALAKRAGCRVIGVVGSTHKVAAVSALGADIVIDKSREALWPAVERAAPGGCHVVLDANGSETLRQSYAHLRPTGRVIVYGFHSLLRRGSDRLNPFHALAGLLKVPRFNPLEMVEQNTGVLAFNLSYLFDELPIFREAMDELMTALERGELALPPVTEVPFDEVARAHELLHSGTTIGKVALVV